MKLVTLDRTVIERVTVTAGSVADARGQAARGGGEVVARTQVGVTVEKVVELK